MEYIYSIIIFVVVICFIMITFIYFYLKREQNEISKIKLHILDTHKLILSYPMINRTYREGPLEKFLEDESVEDVRKVELLSYIANKIDKDDIRLLYNGLSSKSDESRLLCFGVLNQIEKKLNTQINILLKKCEESKDRLKIATYEKDIAYFYWEFVYYGLVSEDLQKFYLQNTEKFAQRALKDYPNKTELYFLLGKVYLKMKIYDKALGFFIKVVKNPYFKDGALPYLAQLYFEKKDFQALKNILDEIKHIKYTPKTLMITSLWRDTRCVLNKSI